MPIGGILAVIDRLAGKIVTLGATRTREILARNLASSAIAGLPALISMGLAAAEPALDGRPAGPAESCVLAAGGSAEVAEVVDGDTLILVDGRLVRLAEIQAPKPLAETGAERAALAEAARRTLEGLLGDGRISLQFGEITGDRHGRLLAQVFLDDGTWLQERMVGAGLATVRPLIGSSFCVDRLFEREREARDAVRGLWQSAEFGAIAANDSSLLERKGLYVVVEGRVVSVGRGNRLDFLNFGHIWRLDFTVTVDVAVSGRMAELGRPVESLAERWVRVRGVIEENGGPAIRLNHPSEIEVLGND
jgi:endonuclease YncB( thermonuclease family)